MAKIRVVTIFVIAQIERATTKQMLTADHQIGPVIELSDATGTQREESFSNMLQILSAEVLAK